MFQHVALLGRGGSGVTLAEVGRHVFDKGRLPVSALTGSAHSPVRVATRRILPFTRDYRLQLLHEISPCLCLPARFRLTFFLRFFPPLLPLLVAALATCFALLMAAFLMLSLPFMLARCANSARVVGRL